jgi:hypothetical protein
VAAERRIADNTTSCCMDVRQPAQRPGDFQRIRRDAPDRTRLT